MTSDPLTTTSQVIVPLAVIVGGIALGIILEILAVGKLRKKVAEKGDKASEVAVLALRYMSILTFSILGVYGAIHLFPMSETLFRLLRKLLHVLMILTGTIIASRFAAASINIYMEKTKGAVAGFTIFINLIKLLVYLIGFMTMLDSIGVSITPILTAMGVGGLAVALGLQTTLANLFSGLHIIASGKLRIGDYIKLSSGEEGYVTDMTWRETEITTSLDNIVVIPNSRLAAASVTNFSFPHRDSFIAIQVGVSYDSDLKKVEEITVEVAKEVMHQAPGGVPEFKPSIQYSGFSDSRIQFALTVRVRDYVNQSGIQHELIMRLHKRYEQEGIVIPYPVRTVIMKEFSDTDHAP
jgi:small-conductance mechanosensitive channel